MQNQDEQVISFSPEEVIAILQDKLRSQGISQGIRGLQVCVRKQSGDGMTVYNETPTLNAVLFSPQGRHAPATGRQDSSEAPISNAPNLKSRTSEPTKQLRLAVPEKTSTEPPRLQQCWQWRDGTGTGFEWRDVPVEVVPGLHRNRS